MENNNLVLNKAELNKALIQLKKVLRVGSHNKFNSLILSGSAGVATLEASTDLLVAKIKIGAEGSAESLSFDLKEFDKYIKRFKDKISIGSDGHLVKVFDDNKKFMLDNTMKEASPEGKRHKLFTTDYNLLENAVTAASHSLSKSESRPVLTAYNLKIKDENVTIVTTDSHRLTRADVPADVVPDPEVMEVNPIGKGLALMKDFKPFSADNVSAYYETNSGREYITIISGQLELRVQLEGGSYPATDQLIPESFNYSVTDTQVKLLDASENAYLITKDSKDSAALLSDGILSAGYGKVETKIKPFEGSAEDIHFNPKYLIESLKTFNKHETITIKFVSALRPFIVTGSDSNHIELITPIRYKG